MVNYALALPEVLDLAVAVGTLSLAGATAWLARATSRMAGASEDQLAELRRHADAAERSAEQAEQQARIEGMPDLRVAHYADGDAWVAVDSPPGRWTLTVKNEGTGPARVLEATLSAGGARVALGISTDTVQPSEVCAVDCAMDEWSRPELRKALDAPANVKIIAIYRDPKRGRWRWEAVLKPKSGGMRWHIVSDDVAHALESGAGRR